MSKTNEETQFQIDLAAAGVWHDIVTVDAAGTRVQAPVSPELRSLDIVNIHATGIAYYGGESVTDSAGALPGVPLNPGDKKEGMALSQASRLWFDSDTTGHVIVLFGLVGSV